MKRSFFQAAVVSILLYGCTTWTLTKRLKKKLDGNYTRMLRAILHKSWRQHPTDTNYTATCLPSRKLYKLDQPDTQDTAGDARTNSSVMYSYGPPHMAKAGRPVRTYIQQLCEDTGFYPEDLPKAMNDWEKWWERVRDIRAGGTSSWSWWFRFCYFVNIV